MRKLEEKRNRKQRVFQRGSVWLGDDVKNVRAHSKQSHCPLCTTSIIIIIIIIIHTVVYIHYRIISTH